MTGETVVLTNRMTGADVLCRVGNDQEPVWNSALRRSRIHAAGSQFLGRCPGRRQRSQSRAAGTDDGTASATGAHRDSGRGSAATPRTRSCRSALLRRRLTQSCRRPESAPAALPPSPLPLRRTSLEPARRARATTTTARLRRCAESPICCGCGDASSCSLGRTHRSFAEGFRSRARSHLFAADLDEPILRLDPSGKRANHSLTAKLMVVAAAVAACARRGRRRLLVLQRQPN